MTRTKKLNLKNLKHFVLDECDKMLAELDMRRDVQVNSNKEFFQTPVKFWVVPDTNFAGYPANNFSGYRISGWP